MSAGQLNRERMAQLLAMFSSDFDGEVCNAARLAETLRKRSGLTWGQILRLAPALPELRRRECEVETVDDALALCEAYADWLTVWERGFVATLARQRSAASPKQIAILDQIVEKLRRAEARAA